MKKGHYEGKKHRGTHTTYIDVNKARKLIRVAEKLDIIKGISFGFIVQMRSNKPRVVFRIVSGGLQAIVFGSNSRQNIMLYCTNADLAQRLIQQKIS